MIRLTRALSLTLLIPGEPVQTAPELVQDAHIHHQVARSVSPVAFQGHAIDESYVDNLLKQTSTAHPNYNVGEGLTTYGQICEPALRPTRPPVSRFTRPKGVRAWLKNAPSRVPEWKRVKVTEQCRTAIENGIHFPRARLECLDLVSPAKNTATCTPKVQKGAPEWRLKPKGVQKGCDESHPVTPSALRIVMKSPSSPKLSAGDCMQILGAAGVSLQTIGSYFRRDVTSDNSFEQSAEAAGERARAFFTSRHANKDWKPIRTKYGSVPRRGGRGGKKIRRRRGNAQKKLLCGFGSVSPSF